MVTLRSFLLCSLLLLAGSAQAETQTVFDDFESGPMPPTTNNGGPPIQSVQSGLPTPLCLAGARTILVFSQAFAAIPPGTIDDRLISKSLAPLAALATLTTARYLFPGLLDLPDGGQHDRFRVDVGPVIGNTQLSILLWTAGATSPSATVTVPVTGPGPIVVPFGQFGLPLPLLQNIQRVEFQTRGGVGASSPELHIRRILLSGQNVVQPTLELPEETVPLSEVSGPLRQVLGEWTHPNGMTLSDHIDFSVDQVEDDLGGVYPGKIQFGDTGGGSTAGLVAGMELQTSGTSFEPGSIALSLTFQSNGTTSSLMSAPTVLVEESNQISISFANNVLSTPGGFTSDGVAKGGTLFGVSEYNMVLELGEFSPIQFLNCQVNGFPGGNVVEIFLDMQDGGGGPAQECDVVFTASLQSFFTPENTSTPAPVLPDPLRLRAEPSVTSATTRLQLSAPVLRPTVLQVFDLRGRLVQDMTLRSGFDAVRWDGRDARGNRLASGIYYARVVGYPGAATKVTIVR